MSDALLSARNQTVQYFIRMMEGVFELNGPDFQTLSYSPLTAPLLSQTLPAGFLFDLVNIGIFTKSNHGARKMRDHWMKD